MQSLSNWLQEKKISKEGDNHSQAPKVPRASQITVRGQAKSSLRLMGIVVLNCSCLGLITQQPNRTVMLKNLLLFLVCLFFLIKKLKQKHVDCRTEVFCSNQTRSRGPTVFMKGVFAQEEKVNSIPKGKYGRAVRRRMLWHGYWLGSHSRAQVLKAQISSGAVAKRWTLGAITGF